MNEKKKNLYKRMAVVALPIILQNVLDAAVNSADVLMINSVGQEAISATSLAISVVSLFFMFLYGIGTGIAMLAAQYYGKGDIDTIEKIEGIGLRYSLGFSSIGALAFLLCPRLLMLIYTSDEALIALGINYLRVMAPGIVFWAISAVYTSVLRCTNRVTTATIIEAISLISNVLLNAVFIFGLLGVPAMGVTGVGIATTLSRLIQLICCIWVSRKAEVKLTLKTMFENHPALNRDFMTMALPAIGNDVVWGLAFSMYTVIFGHLGTDAVAANSIVSTVRNLGCVFCYGIGSAAGIIVGQILGEGNMEEGIDTAKTMFRMAVLSGIFGGLVVLAVTPYALSHAALSETALDYLKFMLLVNTYYVSGTAVNTTLIAGIFRAGGDSKFGFWCDTIDMWVYAVPLGFIAAFVLHLPVKVVYFLLCTDEFVKWPWVFRHFYSNKWAKNITRDVID